LQVRSKHAPFHCLLFVSPIHAFFIPLPFCFQV
jgi:hypothetical protein